MSNDIGRDKDIVGFDSARLLRRGKTDRDGSDRTLHLPPINNAPVEQKLVRDEEKELHDSERVKSKTLEVLRRYDVVHQHIT